MVYLNIEALENKDIEWADYIFLSGMYVQKDSVNKILERCKQYPAKIFAGGPLFTKDFDNYPQIDHFILNEAEITMPQFLEDLEHGCTKRIYQTNEYADLSFTPVPDYHLLKLKAYAFMNMQVSGGFIVGFDSDTPIVFKRQVDFIQKSGIVSAMVGLLNATKNTQLYRQMEKEKPYYKRVRELLRNYNPVNIGKNNVDFTRIVAFLKSVFVLGCLNRGRFECWKLIFWTIVKKPNLFIDAVTLAVYGYHFRKVYGLRKV